MGGGGSQPFSEELPEGPVVEGLAPREAAPFQPQGAASGRGGLTESVAELGEQTALPGAGFAADDQDSAGTGQHRVDGRGGDGHLGIATNQ